jgi:hypothetical protein
MAKASLRPATVSALISVSGEKRWLSKVRCTISQLAASSSAPALTSRSGVTALGPWS